MSVRNKYQWLLLIAFFPLLLTPTPEAGAVTCKPTEPDMLGPFYTPNAPARSSVGKGYMLEGTVRSSKDCSPVPGAMIELWLVGPDGEYDDSHRATISTDPSGNYQFESNLPQPYGGRPPHIHIRISARGFETLATQHYPEPGNGGARFDLVIVPSR